MSRALLDPSKVGLLDLLKQSGGLSVDALVERSPLSKTTVRQHLISLEEQGLLVRAYRKVGRGRPQLVYELSSEGQRLYPSQEGRLFRELLAYLQAEGQGHWIQSFFERFWEERRRRFDVRLASQGEERLSVLLAMLQDEGFMPEVVQSEDGVLTLRECNCPLSQAVEVTRLPCRLEARFIQQVLQREISSVRLMPQGEPICTYVLKPEGGLEV